MLKITPRIFRSIYNRAIFEIIFKGLFNQLSFKDLGLQRDFFTEEDYKFIMDSYNDLLLQINRHLK